MSPISQNLNATIFIALICFSSAFPKNTSFITPNWKKGDKFIIEYTKEQVKTKDGDTVLNGGAITDFYIEVLKVSKEGNTIRLTYGETKFLNPAHAAVPMVKEMTKVMQGLEVEIEISPEGEYKGIKNWDKMQKALAASMEIMISQMKKAEMDAKTVEGLKQYMKNMFSNQQNAEQMVTKEIRLLFAHYGKKLNLNVEDNYESILPNPLGGEPFPAKGYFKLIKMDKKSAEIIWEQEIDGEKAKPILEEFLRKTGKDMGSPVPEEQLFGMINIKDTGKFNVDLESGWCNRIEHKRQIGVDNNARIDKVTMIKKEKDGGLKK